MILRWWHNKWFVHSVGVVAFLVVAFSVWVGTRVVEESAKVLWQESPAE